ncbi:SusD-like starch-binding protein associating with outer membrane [Anseongella ginsenosidimutans]|uniref:SusD-like starch-binding protein associating with outer membrane n=1 Tax=Anseongella ginsenosidimutans TaxID=496056 RepID=A0A4R3KMR1_9SPHI|nr:SusD/RagB family nutrient-binding outer membrane lipoprotein [Anseongella ginsenosidimutans]QEC52053.1 SusD/RagB family nutrient-binding outer membrane lipoprotein [Anseongella ginsenosidimutans]TCS85638.1 SusD-like starch-binding protein associating with outer membrane [Anseongella ginsenosidimutans]
MKKLIIFLFPLIFLASCVENLDDYNIDQKRADEAPPATLFTSALLNLTDDMATPNVNINNFRFYIQQWSATTYLQEPRYDLLSRIIPQNWWEGKYRDVLSDLKEAKELLLADEFLEAAVKDNQRAQIEIIEVYTWSVLVNTFGNIPYSEALNINDPLPKYDDAATIYNDLLARLDTALALLDPSAEGFGDGDLLYNYGDITTGVEGWVKFGNSLKLKLGMILADVDPAKAKAIVEEAAPNVFESNEDKARFPYISTPPNHSTIADNMHPDFSTRQDYVAGKPFVDKLNELEDPRRPFYFTTVDGEYKGGYIGFTNAYADYSHVSDKVIAPDFEYLLMDYSEVEFLLAEAVERGFNVGGTAAGHYNDAITASITYWGGSQAQASAYLLQPDVAYLTAEGNYKQKIGVQKWIALYNRGYDAWTSWRRLDYPELEPVGPGTAPPDTDPQDIPAGLNIPVRLIYPVSEQGENGANRAEAAAAIGGDEVTTKLFWDVN